MQEALWSTILRDMAVELPPFEQRLLESLKWVEGSGDRVVLSAKSQGHAAWFESSHLKRIRSKFHELTGRDIEVKVVVDQGAAHGGEGRSVRENSVSAPSERAIPARASVEDVLAPVLDAPETMEGLVAARMVLTQGWSRWNPIFFHGPSGTGKTLFLHVLRRGLAARGVKVLLTTGDEFSHRYFTSIREGRVSEFMNEAKRAGAFIMDDVHRLRGRDRTLDAFRQIFDAVYERGGFLAFSSHEYPLTDGFPEEVASRLSWGLVIRLRRLGRATRSRLLAHKLREYGVDGAEELAMELADLLPGDGRVIEGVVKRISYLQRMGGLDRSRIAGEIEDQVRRFKTSFSPEEIIEAVTRYFGLERGDLLKDTKARHISRPRGMAMYLVRKFSRASFPQIGELFGGRAHSTVVQVCRRIEKEMESDPRVRLDLESIERLLEEGN